MFQTSGPVLEETSFDTEQLFQVSQLIKRDIVISDHTEIKLNCQIFHSLSSSI